MPTNKQTKLAIRIARILNRYIPNREELDEVLKELEEVIEETEKGNTAADQSTAMKP